MGLGFSFLGKFPAGNFLEGFMRKFLAFLVFLSLGLVCVFHYRWLIPGLALIGMAILIPAS
jgi:hypothetical protein